MKITEESIQISPTETIAWGQIESLRISGDTLVVKLSSGRVLKLGNIRATTMDAAFRAYEKYLRTHADAM